MGIKIEEGLWKKCSGCREILFRQKLVDNLYVCPFCGHHERMPVEDRIKMICRDTFSEMFDNLWSDDPLKFKDKKKYSHRLDTLKKLGKRSEAIITGKGNLDEIEALFGFFDFSFMGGSMGKVVGEKCTLLLEEGAKNDLPVIIFTESGGARMQEGVVSLMQMAKTVMAVNRYKKTTEKPFISVLCHPTTGGVSASFAFLGDVIIAEPNALIGFAGPRVIEQTIRQKLPEDFQRSEFLLKHGMVDMVVKRDELVEAIKKLIYLLSND